MPICLILSETGKHSQIEQFTNVKIPTSLKIILPYPRLLMYYYRKCLGEHLSKFQTKIALSMLLRNFSVEFKDPQQALTPIVHSVLMDVKEDVMVRFVPRLEHSEEG